MMAILSSCSLLCTDIHGQVMRYGSLLNLPSHDPQKYIPFGVPIIYETIVTGDAFTLECHGAKVDLDPSEPHEGDVSVAVFVVAYGKKMSLADAVELSWRNQ